jgi:hypothetical protein
MSAEDDLTVPKKEGAVTPTVAIEQPEHLKGTDDYYYNDRDDYERNEECFAYFEYPPYHKHYVDEVTQEIVVDKMETDAGFGILDIRFCTAFVLKSCFIYDFLNTNVGKFDQNATDEFKRRILLDGDMDVRQYWMEDLGCTRNCKLIP